MDQAKATRFQYHVYVEGHIAMAGVDWTRKVTVYRTFNQKRLHPVTGGIYHD